MKRQQTLRNPEFMSRIRQHVLLPLVTLSASVMLAAPAHAFDAFVIKDIRLEGLARISAASVYGALTVSAGDKVDDSRLNDAVRALFKTGNFEDVQVARDGDVLVFQLVERPSIVSIDISGNKSIDKDALLKGLKSSGLAEGEVFQRSMLDHVRQELEHQYISEGRYAAKINVEMKPKPRNRVAIDIKIQEGSAATIKSINFVGNAVFNDAALRDVFQQKASHLTSFFSSDNKYSREKLGGDLESLRSWYLDRGYVNFVINSTQVTVTPDKKDVYIDVNISEGDKFTVGEVKVVGEVPIPDEQLKPLLLLHQGEVFSQQKITGTQEIITKRLGNDGYVFADVQGVPDVDNDKKIAAVTFFVNSGKQAYVRRISFKGNDKTDDNVMRREMRQFEGSLASTEKIDLSKVRLQRLGYFKEVKIDTPRVSGANDQVDVNVSVEEQPSGSLGASIGYSQGSGVTLSANISQDNFLGSGDHMSLGFNRSQLQESYNLSFVDPYFTLDGISRGYSLYYTKTKFSSLNLSNYVTDSQGGRVSFGYPVDETETVNLSLGVDETKITEGSLVSSVVDDFLRRNGTNFQTFTASAAWSRNTLNRGIFADRGYSQSLGLELAIPGSDLTYYKLSYNNQLYVPVAGPFVMRLHSSLGYGGGFGNSDQLPFFKNYFAGGFGSVRGFRDNTLGARSPTVGVVNDTDPSIIGGNILVTGGAELVVPTPFGADNRQLRTVLFLDGGNAYDSYLPGNYFDLYNMRYSTGVALSWLTPIGPLSFALAKPLRDQPGDKTQVFQFSIGQGF
jgi:outer membrane protein insertion porin family